jgi:hypothetical protein
MGDDNFTLVVAGVTDKLKEMVSSIKDSEKSLLDAMTRIGVVQSEVKRANDDIQTIFKRQSEIREMVSGISSKVDVVVSDVGSIRKAHEGVGCTAIATVKGEVSSLKERASGFVTSDEFKPIRDSVKKASSWWLDLLKYLIVGGAGAVAARLFGVAQ